MSSAGVGFTEDLSQDIGQEELDFSDLFLYNSPGEDFPVGCDKDDSAALLQRDNRPPLLVVDHHTAYISTSNQPASRQEDAFSNSPTTANMSGAVFDTLGLASRPGSIPAPSPRIEITPSGDSLSSQSLELSPGTEALWAYRECVSPASSNSSTGWPVKAYSPLASPSISPSNGGMGLSSLDLQGIHTSSTHSSPGASPRNSVTDETFLVPRHQRDASSLPHRRSRSVSPHGKRSYDPAHSCQEATPVKQRSRSPSPIPSLHEHQRSCYIQQYQARVELKPQTQTSSPGLEEMLSSLSSGLPRATPYAVVRDAQGEAQRPPGGYGEGSEQERRSRAGAEVKCETFYVLPAVWPPPHPVHHRALGGLSAAPLPSLEWQLPSQSAQYELLVQQEPRSHHRAHYETEGSRGAVKTPGGGHPEVQLRGYQGAAPLGLQVFIGTADEKIVKPHAFYQVHRITGKTVTTASTGRMMSGTKVLEIPLKPKNHMRVMIDCVGILKLRNADIELRNGETDVGRKNTRVRLVFRVHIPQPGGQVVSLQAASHPIECSQRSAQELPAVQRQDMDRCSVLGGQQMVLTGQNFTTQSKVIFSERTQDGEQIWEVEATVDGDKTQANMLFVEVPPYRSRTISSPAKVNFYVVNGKKKHSQPQHFVYTPHIAIKAEPLDDYQLNSYIYSDNPTLSGLSMKLLYHHLDQESNLQSLNVSPATYHLTSADPRAHVLIPDPLDEQSVYFRASTLTDNPALYHTENQRYGNRGDAIHGSQMAPHPTSAPSPCVSVRNPMGKLGEGPQVGESFKARVVSRHQSYTQTMMPRGKSPPLRYIHGQAQGKAGSRVEPLTQIDSARGNYEKRDPEGVTVKQEHLRYAYLEDVNDIIRRDMKGHDGE